MRHVPHGCHVPLTRRRRCASSSVSSAASVSAEYSVPTAIGHDLLADAVAAIHQRRRHRGNRGIACAWPRQLADARRIAAGEHVQHHARLSSPRSSRGRRCETPPSVAPCRADPTACGSRCRNACPAMPTTARDPWSKICSPRTRECRSAAPPHASRRARQSPRACRPVECRRYWKSTAAAPADDAPRATAAVRTDADSRKCRYSDAPAGSRRRQVDRPALRCRDPRDARRDRYRSACSTTGLCRAPADTMTCRAVTTKFSPLLRVNRAASTRPPAITSRSSGLSVSTVRFGRRRHLRPRDTPMRRCLACRSDRH